MKSLFTEDNPYININRDKPFTDEKIKEAIKWCEENNGYIVLPDNHNEDDKTEPYTMKHIEFEWAQYEQLPHKLRRMSDWKALELFDMDNKTLFEFLREIFSVKDINKNTMEEEKELQLESVMDMSDQVDYDRIDYGIEEIENAKQWCKINNLIMIIPCTTLEELEKQWENFNYMIQKHRRISDWESERIFGVTNQKHYIWLKRKMLQSDIENISVDDMDHIVDSDYIVPDSSSFMEKYIKSNINRNCNLVLVESLVDYLNMKEDSIYNRITNHNMLNNIIEFEELINRIDSDFLPSSDLPFYTPDEMLDMGVFNHVDVDNYYNTIADNNELVDDISTRAWFEEYIYHFNGIDTPNRQKLYKLRTAKLNELCKQLDILKEKNASSEEICAKKQSILELGWNPNIKYNPVNRVKVNNFYLQRCNAHSFAQIINMKNLHFINEEESTVTQFRNNSLKPIFIILTSGKSAHSQLIKIGTMSQYSHCLIGFDPSLKYMYSYDGSGGNGKGGFRIDSVSNYEDDQKINVFCIFVKEEDYNIIKNNIEYLKDHIKETSYSIRNLLSYVFHPIPVETNNMNLFCSQFVDKMLKSIGVDLTKKKSNHVSPTEFKKQSKKNNKIYNVFEDIKGNFSPEYVSRSVEVLLSKDGTTAIKEFVNITNKLKRLDESYYKNIYSTFIEGYMNAEAFEYEDMIKEDCMTFNYLDKIIKCFGNQY